MSKTVVRLALSGALVLGLVVAAGAALSPMPRTSAQTREAPTPAQVQATPVPAQAPAPLAAPPVVDVARLGDAFATVAAAVSPAVVTIRVEAVRQVPEVPFGFRGSPFGQMPPGFGMPNDGQPDVITGGGSGVIIRGDGYIVTNNHVVAQARRLDVVLQDGRSFEGRVVGTDPATDIAVIRIDARNLPTARFASSDAARVGEWVMAIGSPFGLDYTVTTGVLSAKGRGGLGANEIEDYLQTDASINPGNSGGPLVNLRGDVLGINTMIIGRGTGIGFAVPSDIAQSVSSQLIDTGRVRRAWLGVGFQELSPELASQFGVPVHGGALISNVVPGGPAARAGLRPGDVVVAVGDQPVREGNDLLRQVLRQRVDTNVTVQLLRERRPQTVTMRLAERPTSPTTQHSPQVAPPPAHRDDLGLQLAPMTSQVRQQLRYSGAGAVVVTGVSSGSAADRAGLRQGDVIVESDHRPVRQPSQIAQALADGTALLRVERGDGAFYTVLDRTR